MNIALRALRAAYRKSGLKAKILRYADDQRNFAVMQQKAAFTPIEQQIETPLLPPSTKEQISIFDSEAIDKKVALADASFVTTGQIGMSVLNGFEVVDEVKRPDDPFSPEYRDWVMRTYEVLSGKEYSNTNEGTPLDVPAMIKQPYPYNSRNYTAVADQMIGWAHIVKTMELPPGASILEFGPGWGSTTITLAAMGYDLTVIEIEPNFCEVIKGRAAPLGVDIKFLCEDFMVVETIGRQFDALLFFESFHHCADHHRLMAALDRVVKPGGRIFFASEPLWGDWPAP